MAWQLYSVHQPMEMHIVSVFALLHTPTIDYRHIIQLKSGRSMVVGHVLTVHTCSFMCTNHTDMIAHTPAFYKSGSTPVIRTSIMQAEDGWQFFFQHFFQNFSHGDIQTQDLPLGKQVP